uniref:poly(A)-specific ribonuclease n=1 Tax=Trichuris muris TaxID=70415 RepID=A0A5S6QB69_TRIMR
MPYLTRLCIVLEEMEDIDAASHGIVNVWKGNMHNEVDVLSDLVEEFPIVALDTEFPGLVVLDENDRKSKRCTYDTVRLNVENSQLIQAGLSFFSEDGRQPPGANTWQFNFNFTLGINPIVNESYELLASAGVNFNRLAADGISRFRFAERMLMSGVLLNPDVKWLTFQGGFDFAYLLKMFSNMNLPRTHDAFMEELKYYFPVTYDLREMLSSCGLHGGLQAVATQLKVDRIGTAHQAGSDSMTTGFCFFKLREICKDNSVNMDDMINKIHGLD